MTPERYAQIKELFLAACARPAGARAAFIEQACATDPELRTAVEQLLAQHSDPAPPHPAEPGAPAIVAAPGPPQPTGGGRDLAPGRMIAGRYRIVSLLGRGGMGEVYRADDLTLDQPVALKFLPVELGGDPSWSARLRQEVRLAREITHPCVCRIHDITLAGDDTFISMEYIDGEDLRTLLKRVGHVPAERALEIARQLCVGLAAAHARGVLHRDLKPANVMIDGRGCPRILDFGLAAIRSSLSSADIRSGTPAYMAPEQLAGRDVSERSDVYSLGLVLYELFTGRPAFPRAARGPAAHEESERPTPAASVVRDLDPRIELAIQQCLAFNPAERPASALALLAALPGGDALAAAQALGAVPTPSLVAAVLPERRFPAMAGVAALLVGLVLLPLMAALTSRAHPIVSGMVKPPAVLVDRARDLLRASPPPASEAWGFRTGLAAYLEAAGAKEGVLAPLLSERHAGDVMFWYRCSDRPLVAGDPLRLLVKAGRPEPLDPPLSAVGDALIVLDGQGRLRGLEARAGGRWGLEEAPAFDALQSAADLSAELLPAEPRLLPRVAWDGRDAWCTEPRSPATPGLRVEYATLRDRPAAFAVLSEDRGGADVERILDARRREQWMLTLQAGWLVAAFPFAALLAWRHRAQGLADLAGATRLAVVVLGLRLTRDLLGLPHTADARIELGLLLAAAGSGLLEAALVWLLYVALEPLVRRFWPQTELSWTRLLAGRWRDPLVARDVLVGAAAGVAWAMLARLADLLPRWLGFGGRLPVQPEDVYLSALGMRPALVVVLDALRWSVYQGLLALLLIVLLRWWLRRAWLAAALAALLLAPLAIVGRAQPAAALLLLGLVLIPTAMAILIRYGLLAGVTGLFVGALLVRLPLTAELTRWYADAGLLGATITVVLLAAGFALARRGHGAAGA